MSESTFVDAYEAASITDRTTAMLFLGLAPPVLMAALTGGPEAVRAVMTIAAAGIARDCAQQLYAIDHPQPEPDAPADDDLGDMLSDLEEL